MLSKRTQKEIIFDDLDSPKLTFLQKIALSNSKKGKINFTQAAVLDAAKKQTGLSDLEMKVLGKPFKYYSMLIRVIKSYLV